MVFVAERFHARTAIHAAAERFFQRDVTIDERAFQAFEVLTHKRNTPHAIHVWRSLTEALPAISVFYERLGLDAANPLLRRPLVHTGPWLELSHVDWESVFRDVFATRNLITREYTLTAAAREVQLTGRLTPRVIALSILASARMTFHAGLVSNLVLRRIGRGLGVALKRAWTAETEAVLSFSISLFEKVYACDSSGGEQQFVVFHDGRGIRLRPFGTVGAYLLQEQPLPDGSLWVARGNALQPPTRFSEIAVTELESLINSDARELLFQQFFETHPEFLLALGNYRSVHPQVILHEENGGRLIPDFFLEKVNSDFSDICDLKRPSAELIRRQQNRDRFRSAVMEAVAQLTLYRDWFEDSRHREIFHLTYGLQAYRPRVVLIIGRRKSYYDEVEQIRLESSLPSWVTLSTYDDVVARARNWKKLISA